MRILVTGATGFVGRNLIPRLLHNNEVFEISIEPEASKKLFNDKITTFHFNNNQKDLINFIELNKPEIIIHLASYLTSEDEFENAEKLLNSNIKFLINILDTCKFYQPKLFINTGSFAEYLYNDGKLEPAYLYAATKTASRGFLQYYSGAYNFKYVTMVPYSIYGSNDSQKKLIDYLIDSAQNPIDFTAGEQILDFIHVEDVVNAYLSVLDNIELIESGSTFYIGTGIGTSIKELAEIIERNVGKKLTINWGKKEYRKRDVMKAVANVNQNKLDWSAKIILEQGIKKLCQK